MRTFDVVLFGATGFTGRLVAEYLKGRVASGRFALAGRDAGKLRALTRELGVDLPILVGDAKDAKALGDIAVQTKVVCTTVGPYAKYGEGIVAACVEKGTDCCDLTGEPHFIRRMIDRHHAAAEASGARIVHTCGFDSIPSDLGVWELQRHARAAHGAPATKVRLGVTTLKGGASGGTIASMLNIVDEAKRDKDVRRVLLDPYSLQPEGERSGPDGLGGRAPAWSEELGGWTAPFVMAGINERVVRRTNALSGYRYGRDFSYHELMSFKPGPAGFAKAVATTAAIGGLFAATAIPPLRALLEGRVLPAPGEGPSKEEQESGRFAALIVGEGVDSAGKPFTVRERVAGRGDPGYAATARMLGESALCLAEDERTTSGGILTPAFAMGKALIERLRKVDITFDVRP